MQQTILLQPLELGNVILLKNVLFRQGSDNFIDNSERSLDLVVEMMNDNPEVKILLKGHTDNVGNKVLNIQLSQMRVNKVKAYLVEQGIALIELVVLDMVAGSPSPIIELKQHESPIGEWSLRF